MKTVWFGIFGLMAAFTAVVAWYAYERAQTPEPASLQSQKTGKDTAKSKVAAVKEPPQEAAKPPLLQPPAKQAVKAPVKPALSVVAKPEATKKAAAPKAKKPEPVKPSFDVVRVEPDGSAVIAGRAMPGWRVKVQLQGKTIGKAVANRRGEWVVITETPVPYGTSSMQLSALSPDMLSTATSTQIVAISRPREPKLAALPVKTPDANIETPIAEKPAVEKPVPAAKEPVAEKATPEIKTQTGDDTAKSAPLVSPGSSGATDNPAAAIPPEMTKSMAETTRTMTETAKIVKPAPESSKTLPDMKGKSSRAIESSGADAGNAPKPAMPVAEKPAAAGEKPAIVAKVKTSEPQQKPEMPVAKKPEPVKPQPEAPAARMVENTAAVKAEPLVKTGVAKIAKPEMVAAKKTESKPQPAGKEAEKPARPADETVVKKTQAEPLVVVSEPGKPSKVLQSSGAPQAAKPLSFRAVDYNDTGQVILSGKAEKGSTLRVYLNNDYIGNTTASDTGEWVLKTKKHISPGKYTLRVDQLGKANRIAARVEAPFERAAPAAVARARINGEVVIQPGDNLWNLSRAYYGSGVQYTVIYEANRNKIKDPDFIYPGQIFITPDSDPAAREAEREALRQKMLRRR